MSPAKNGTLIIRLEDSMRNCYKTVPFNCKKT